MKKISFRGLVNNYERNSNTKAFTYNNHLILPKVGAIEFQENIRSISFTEDSRMKIDKLSKKYKLSRSAIVRILLDSVKD